jgi:hypothetical protein
MVNKLAYKPSVRDKDIMDKYYEMFRDKNGTKKKMCVLLQRGKLSWGFMVYGEYPRDIPEV